MLWGQQAVPQRVVVAGKAYALELRKKRFKLPFTVRLIKAYEEKHPGTQMASAYASDVVRIQEGDEQSVHIAMNEPLRHQGYTLFQSEFGMAADGQTFSVFAVVSNPADQWPLYSCIVIWLGLQVHFTIKLVKFIKSQQKKRAKA